MIRVFSLLRKKLYLSLLTLRENLSSRRQKPTAKLEKHAALQESLEKAGAIPEAAQMEGEMNLLSFAHISSHPVTKGQ
jgi:hypothetical protein